MTITLMSAAAALQAVGLAGSLLGIALTTFSGGGLGLLTSAAAAGLDGVSIVLSPSANAILAALVKIVGVSLVWLLLSLSTGGPRTGPAPAIDPSLGLLAVSWSSLPSVAGAILRRFAK